MRTRPPQIADEAVLAAVDARADPDLLDLFDLEGRLDEVDRYAARFAAAHTGTDDDRTAFDGLAEALTREPRVRP